MHEDQARKRRTKTPVEQCQDCCRTGCLAWVDFDGVDAMA
jgi:hypothetical protein